MTFVFQKVVIADKPYRDGRVKITTVGYRRVLVQYYDANGDLTGEQEMDIGECARDGHIEAYWDLLKDFDWYWQYSDDIAVTRRYMPIERLMEDVNRKYPSFAKMHQAFMDAKIHRTREVPLRNEFIENDIVLL